MGVETIIAIITAVIAFVTSVASFTYNLIQSRKERVQKVILENRIKYLHEIRVGFSEFIGLANMQAIKATRNSDEVKQIYFSNLVNGYGKIKTYIKPFFDMDEELLAALDKVYFCVLSLLNGEKGDEQSLDSLREDFARKYLKYDWAYWEYIQTQRDGKYLNSDGDFDTIYQRVAERVDEYQKQSK